MALPLELLWEIAKKSSETYYALATALPCIGRDSLQPHIQEKMKAHFIVKKVIFGYITESILPNGWRHSVNDEPAVITHIDNTNKILYQEWYHNGKLHRDNDKPAGLMTLVETNEKFEQAWYCNGQLHRDNDNPAYIQSEYIHYWYVYGNNTKIEYRYKK